MGGEVDQLDGETCDEDVAPDHLVLEEFGDEPAKAEGFLFGFETGDFFVLAGTGGFLGDEDQLRLELGDGFVDGQGLRAL